MLFLDFLPGLPEEEIGADRRAEDRDEGRGIGGVELDIGYHHRPERLAPGDMDDEQHRDIGEEGEGRPFEDRGIAWIAESHLEDDAEDAEQQGVEPGIAAGQQRQRRAHGAEIGAEVDDVRHQQERYHRPQ